MALNTSEPIGTLPEFLTSDYQLVQIMADTMRGEMPTYVDYRLVRGLVIDLQRARYAALRAHATPPISPNKED